MGIMARRRADSAAAKRREEHAKTGQYDKVMAEIEARKPKKEAPAPMVAETPVQEPEKRKHTPRSKNMPHFEEHPADKD